MGDPSQALHHASVPGDAPIVNIHICSHFFGPDANMDMIKCESLVDNPVY